MVKKEIDPVADRHGTADQMGKLFCRPKSVVQLATDSRAGVRASLPCHARGCPFGGSRSLREILADRPKPSCRNRAGEAVAQRERSETCREVRRHLPKDRFVASA